MTEQGEVVLIAGISVPRDIATKRKRLEDRITRHGFEPTMEAIAYTWFNRLAAIRFMELHGYLDHGYRVLSHPDRQADAGNPRTRRQVSLPGLNKTSHRPEARRDQGRGALPAAADSHSAMRCTRRCRFCSSGSTTRRNCCSPRTCSTSTRSSASWSGDRRGGLAGGRDHRLALPVLHLGEEGPGDRQGGRQRGHPGRHAAFHAELDRQVPGAEHARSAMAGDVPATRRSGSR